MPTIEAALVRAAEEYPAGAAISCGDQRWNRSQLLANVGRAGDWLESFTALREPVLFVPRNTPASVAFVFAAIVRGRVPLLADPAWTPAELAVLMHRCSIATAAWEGSPPEEVDGRRESGAGYQAVVGRRERHGCVPEIAVGRFSSGSTGTARCLGFSQRAVLEAARSWGTATGYGPRDRVLCLATLNNGLAFNAVLFAVLLSGAELVFHPGRLLVRSIARTLGATEPTVLVAFPFVYKLLAHTSAADESLGRLRLAISSAAPLDPAVKEAWSRKAGRPVCDYYGLVEVGPCTFNDGSDLRSVGRPLPGVSITVAGDDGRVADQGQTGRILVRTDSMAHEFLDSFQPRLAANVTAEGQYVTRDLGHFDESGRLHVTARVGRQINIEGRKIEPSEIETVLCAISGVRDAVVIAEERSTSTRLAAYVEATDVSRAQIARHCVEQLAAYKIPQHIEVLDRLPRSSTGKVSVGRLRSPTHEGGSR